MRKALILMGIVGSVLWIFQNCANETKLKAASGSSVDQMSMAPDEEIVVAGEGDIVFSSVPSNASFYVTQNFAVSATAISKAGLALTYQWSKDGQILPTQTDTVLRINGATAADAGEYALEVKNEIDRASIQVRISISNLPTVTFTTQPVAVSVFFAQPIVLSALAVSSETTATLAYQWFKDGRAIAGATLPSLRISSATAADAGVYHVQAGTQVANSPKAQSNQVAVSVRLSTLSIVGQPQPITVGPGIAGILSVTASNLAAQPMAYQWFKDNVAIAGATAASFNVGSSGAARAGLYFVQVRSTLGPAQAVNSNTVKVTAVESFNVLSSQGCVSGYCACVTAGQLNVPDRNQARAICLFKGYADVTTFTTSPGPINALQCSANGSGCFANANPGNIVCSQVDCMK